MNKKENKKTNENVCNNNRVITYPQSSMRESNPPEVKKNEKKFNGNRIKNLFNKRCIIISTVLLIVVIGVAIVVPVITLKNNKNNDKIDTDNLFGDKDKEGGDIGQRDIGPIVTNKPFLTKEEALKVFEPCFNIASKEDTLT